MAHSQRSSVMTRVICHLDAALRSITVHKLFIKMKMVKKDDISVHHRYNQNQ